MHLTQVQYNVYTYNNVNRLRDNTRTKCYCILLLRSIIIITILKKYRQQYFTCIHVIYYYFYRSINIVHVLISFTCVRRIHQFITTLQERYHLPVTIIHLYVHNFFISLFLILLYTATMYVSMYIGKVYTNGVY